VVAAFRFTQSVFTQNIADWDVLNKASRMGLKVEFFCVLRLELRLSIQVVQGGIRAHFMNEHS
jgi:hypothetical protein